TYRRRLNNVLDAEKEIAAAVTLKLGQQPGSVKSDTNSNEAWHLYRQGRYFWQKPMSDETTQKMGDYFQKAIAIDPNYALAYAGLADYYATLAASGAEQGADSWRKSEEAAVKALALDESIAEAHHSLAAFLMWHDRNWKQAEKELKRAIE